MAVWLMKVPLSDIWKNEDLSLEEQRDQIVARLREHQWFKESDDVQNLVDELADAEGVTEFDAVWSALYDQADVDRVWIDLWDRVPS